METQTEKNSHWCQSCGLIVECADPDYQDDGCHCPTIFACEKCRVKAENVRLTTALDQCVDALTRMLGLVRDGVPDIPGVVAQAEAALDAAKKARE